MQKNSSINENLEKVLHQLGIDSSPSQSKQLFMYCEWILEWNTRANVTGKKNIVDFIDGPLFDGLTLFAVLGAHQRFVDIGSGGGLPAVPLAILRPEIEITMVEPRAKRVEFLNFLVERLDLTATVLHTQDREIAQLGFDGASAQAVFPVQKWLSKAKKLLSNGGKIYTLTSEEVTTKHLPKNVSLEVQRCMSRGAIQRYAARLVVQK